MNSKNHNELHIIFFPFMAHGHMIPTTDMAKLFALQGVKTTIITTPCNSNLYSHKIQRTKNMGFDINIQIIKYPTEGHENVENDNEMGLQEEIGKFFMDPTILKEPLEQILKDLNPSCIVADIFFPWTTDISAKFGIPRLVFHGTSFFSLCISECLRMSEPHKKVSSDSEPFLLTNLPDEIMLTRSQLPDFMKFQDDKLHKIRKDMEESVLKSYGVIANSFYELEPAYTDFYKKELGIRRWSIGPVSLCNRTLEDKAERGVKASIDEHECLTWLNSKKLYSVIYISFGSIVNFSTVQLKEIALGLEASGQQFIWVVKKENKEEWLPEGFEERTEGKGLIITGWAPQVMILDHEAIGGFVTHCGWNSILEAITAGVPMVTWPVFAEQFYNEKLVTNVLKIGIGIGAKTWSWIHGDDSIKSDDVEKAVTEIMVGDEAKEMRRRVKGIGEMARIAVEEGGSSFSDLENLIEELRTIAIKK